MMMMMMMMMMIIIIIITIIRYHSPQVMFNLEAPITN